MTFPGWFYLAAALTFMGDKIHSKFRLVNEVALIHEAASKYLALVLSHPFKEESFNRCSILLDETSKSWMTMMTSSSNSRIKKRKTSTSDIEGSRIAIWLKKFDKCHEEFYISFGLSKREMRTMEIIDQKSSILFRRVPLGILISHSILLEERECILLLNYAATGEIISTEISPLKGATLVFSLFDYIEEICASAFDQEDEGKSFARLIKSKTASYLLRCVRELLQNLDWPKDGGETNVMWKDFSARLAGWREHGVSDDILEEIGRM